VRFGSVGVYPLAYSYLYNQSDGTSRNFYKYLKLFNDQMIVNTQLTLAVQNSGNTLLWTNPNNGLVENGVVATIAPGNTSARYFVYDVTNYTSIPANCTIVGVQIRIRYRASTTTPTPFIKAGYLNLAENTFNTNSVGSTTLSYYTFGGSTTNLGVSNREDLMMISFRVSQSATGALTHSLDHAILDVWYDTDPLAYKPNILFTGELF
jgi:hypothetical protein